MSHHHTKLTRLNPKKKGVASLLNYISLDKRRIIPVSKLLVYFLIDKRWSQWIKFNDQAIPTFSGWHRVQRCREYAYCPRAKLEDQLHTQDKLEGVMLTDCKKRWRKKQLARGLILVLVHQRCASCASFEALMLCLSLLSLSSSASVTPIPSFPSPSPSVTPIPSFPPPLTPTCGKELISLLFCCNFRFRWWDGPCCDYSSWFTRAAPSAPASASPAW